MGRKIRSLFLLALASNTLVPAWDATAADEARAYLDGNALFSQFASTNSVVRDSATEYVIAVIDTVYVLRSTDALRVPVLCIPPGVQIRQAGDVVKKHLADHPEGRHYTAASEVLRALLTAFPCPQN
jgi:hypothetical protein